MFGQTFSSEDIATVGLLVVLEGLLSIDNALVLGLLAARVKPHLRGRVLSYGLVGAFILRLVAIAATAFLLRWPVIKLVGGLYLLWVALKYFWQRVHARSMAAHHPGEAPPPPARFAGFWRTIAAIELTDLAFAVDSILAGVALVGSPPPGTAPGAVHPKLWVIVTGGMLGVVLMRFAAAIFARLLEKFPRLNFSAYLLVGLIAIKLIIDWAVNDPSGPEKIDFQDPRAAPFWIFWGAILACLTWGFVAKPARVLQAEENVF